MPDHSVRLAQHFRLGVIGNGQKYVVSVCDVAFQISLADDQFVVLKKTLCIGQAPVFGHCYMLHLNFLFEVVGIICVYPPKRPERRLGMSPPRFSWHQANRQERGDQLLIGFWLGKIEFQHEANTSTCKQFGSLGACPVRDIANKVLRYS